MEIQPRFKIQYPMKNHGKNKGEFRHVQYHFVVLVKILKN
jgi:hypothetical protein